MGGDFGNGGRGGCPRVRLPPLLQPAGVGGARAASPNAYIFIVLEDDARAAAGAEGRAGPKGGRKVGGGAERTRGVLGTHHDARVLGAADDGGEDRAGRVVTGEAGLAHAGAIVHNESLNLLTLRDGEGGKRRGNLR
jgi:hypothetical protein